MYEAMKARKLETVEGRFSYLERLVYLISLSPSSTLNGVGGVDLLTQ